MVRTATYGPGIDQSQHAKSVSHIINNIILKYLSLDIEFPTHSINPISCSLSKYGN